MLLIAAYVCDRGLDPIVYAAMYLGPDAERRLLAEDFVQDSIQRFVLFCFCFLVEKGKNPKLGFRFGSVFFLTQLN